LKSAKGTAKTRNGILFTCGHPVVIAGKLSVYTPEVRKRNYKLGTTVLED